MNFNKLILLSSFALITLPIPALSIPLTLINGTTKPLTVKIEQQCNYAFGVIRPNNFTTLTEDTLNQICQTNLTHCYAQVYASKNCTGKAVAYFIFDTKYGLSTQFNSIKKYAITVDFLHNYISLS